MRSTAKKRERNFHETAPLHNHILRRSAGPGFGLARCAARQGACGRGGRRPSTFVSCARSFCNHWRRSNLRAPASQRAWLRCPRSCKAWRSGSAAPRGGILTEKACGHFRLHVCILFTSDTPHRLQLSRCLQKKRGAQLALTNSQVKLARRRRQELRHGRLGAIAEPHQRRARSRARRMAA